MRRYGHNSRDFLLNVHKAMVRLRGLPFKAKADAKRLFAKEEKKEKEKEQALSALMKVQAALKGAAERAGCTFVNDVRHKNREILEKIKKQVVKIFAFQWGSSSLKQTLKYY